MQCHHGSSSLVHLLIPLLNEAIDHIKLIKLPNLFQFQSCPASTLDDLQFCDALQTDVAIDSTLAGHDCTVHVNVHELKGLGHLKIDSLDYTFNKTDNQTLDVHAQLSIGVLSGILTTRLSSSCNWLFRNSVGRLANCNKATVSIGTTERPNLIDARLSIPVGCSDLNQVSLEHLEVSLSSIAIYGCGVLSALSSFPGFPDRLAAQVSKSISTIAQQEINRLIQTID